MPWMTFSSILHGKMTDVVQWMKHVTKNHKHFVNAELRFLCVCFKFMCERESIQLPIFLPPWLVDVCMCIVVFSHKIAHQENYLLFFISFFVRSFVRCLFSHFAMPTHTQTIVTKGNVYKWSEWKKNVEQTRNRNRIEVKITKEYREMAHKMWKWKKYYIVETRFPFFFSFISFLREKNDYLISHVFDTYYYHTVDIFLLLTRATTIVAVSYPIFPFAL